MDTAWIQVFILTFAECVAPAGKSVCQPQQFELQFLNRRDCEYAMQQMIDVKDQLDYVIVDRAKTQCVASAAEAEVIDDAEAIQQSSNSTAISNSEDTPARRAAVNAEHGERLAAIKSCNETNGIAPCKIGDIIVEAANGDEVEVWRRD